MPAVLVVALFLDGMLVGLFGSVSEFHCFLECPVYLLKEMSEA